MESCCGDSDSMEAEFKDLLEPRSLFRHSYVNVGL